MATEITSWAELAAINSGLTGDYVLMNDLDSHDTGYDTYASSSANGGLGWLPIGNSTNKFTGTFDGDNKIISDIYINRTTDNIGLFGYVSNPNYPEIYSNGIVKNIGVKNITIYGSGDNIGGLIGVDVQGLTENSWTTGTINLGTSETNCVGGLVGWTISYKEFGELLAKIDNSYSSINVSASESNYVGGLVGKNWGWIIESYATGSVSGDTYVGGLSGVHNGNIIDSYSSGAVTADSTVGGLVGENTDWGWITESYATGAVQNATSDGGLVGVDSSSELVSGIFYSYYDSETSGQSDTGKGIPQTTAEMEDLDTFSADWDIVAIGDYVDETWYIDDGNDYPHLGWELASEAFRKRIYETLTTTDTFSYDWTLARIYSETLTLTDSIIRGKIFSEALTLTDSITRGKIFSETLTLTDAYSRVWDATPIFSETLTLSDGDNYGQKVVLTETLTLTDSITRGKIFSETLTLTDAYSRVWDATPIFSETLTLTDGDIRLVGIDLEETLTLTDALTPTAEKVLSETLTLTDAYSRTWDATREFSETLTLSAGDTYGQKVVLTETITLSDGDNYSKLLNLIETITLTDGDTWGPILSETLTLTDTYSYNWALARIYSETLTLTDSIIRGKIFSEALTLTDTVIPWKLKILSETLSLTDAYSRVWDATRELTETLTLSVGDAYGQSIELTETLTLTDGDIHAIELILTEELTLRDTRGTTDDTSLYIKNATGQWVEYKDYKFFKIVRKQNQISEFEISILDIEASDKVFVKEFAEVLFLSGADLILKGRIQKITYETGYTCKITGYGMEAKLLDKEFDELSNTTATWSDSKRAQYTNASAQTIAKELLSAGSDGATTWIMNPALDGIFLSDYGDTSIRFEYANRLKALASLSESLVDPTYQGAYEWWVSQSPVDDYGLDSFNMANLQPTNTRATVSQETFAISGGSSNASQTFNEKDITNLANKVDVLGYGDGINQIHTSTFNASPTYSTLASDIAVDTASIVLADAGDFDSSGEIRIMEERITYSGKTTNTLTGCTRGANSTTARPHQKGVYIEKYVAVASAEADSSISDNGLMDYSVTKREILDLPTAELVASRILMDRMTPITSIRIIPDEPLQTAASRQVGDMITVTDAESAITGDYRIVGITYQSDYGYLSMELEVSNKTLNFIDQMVSQKEEAEKLSKYMQGATNLYSIQSYENCDNTYPLYIRFYLPADAVAINDVDLRFTTQKYRGYTSVTEVNSAKTAIASSDAVASSVAVNSNAWTNVVGITTANTDCDGVFLDYSVDMVSLSGNGGSGQFRWRIYDGTSYYPKESSSAMLMGGYLPFDTAPMSGNASAYIPGNNKNKTYTLQVKWDGFSNDDNWIFNASASYLTTSQHTHNVGHGISEDTFPSGSPQVAVAVSDGAGGWNTATGSPFSVSDDGTYDTDITSEVSEVGAGNWVTVRCTPQNGTDHNNLRIEANLNTKVFIQSRV